MRLLDPDLELVACGSSALAMPTFGAWEPTVLEHAYDVVDYISLPRLLRGVDGDLGSFLASAVDMDHFIDGVVATADRVGARLKQHASGSTSRSTSGTSGTCSRVRAGRRAGDRLAGRAAACIEDHYNVADAVVVGSLLITLLRHSDRVTAACQAQLVNVIAPIMTEPGGPAWRQTIFHPFALTARLAKGDGAAGRAASRRRTRPTGSARSRSSTRWPPTTRTPATSPSSW